MYALGPVAIALNWASGIPRVNNVTLGHTYMRQIIAT